MKAMQKLRNISNFLKKAQSQPTQPTREEYEEKGVIVVLQYNAHCDHCAEDVKNCIKKMKGVVSVDLDVNNSQVTVEGVFDVQKLVHHIFKKAEKRVKIVKQEKAGGQGNTAPSPPISTEETSNNEEGQREESDDHSHEVEREREIIEEKGDEIRVEKIGEIGEVK